MEECCGEDDQEESHGEDLASVSIVCVSWRHITHERERNYSLETCRHCGGLVGVRESPGGRCAMLRVGVVPQVL